MRAFIVGTAAAIVIGIVAGLILNTMSTTTAQTYTSGDVRL